MKTRQIDWEDSNFTAVLAPLAEGIDQCSILQDGNERAHLFLLGDGLIAVVDIDLKEDIPPCHDLLVAIARIIVAHKVAAREGRTLV